MIILKSRREIEMMREAGRIVARVHQAMSEAIKPGVSVLELDEIAESIILEAGARPAFKGYPHPTQRNNDFPATLCVSINDEVVHGIPGPRKLKEGDIISIDCGAVLNEYFGDAAATYAVGEISPEAQCLLDVTRRALSVGIDKCRAGNRLSDIGHAIQTLVESEGFSVVRDYVGHGVGRAMHEEPQVPHYGPPGLGPVLEVGMVLAIEPMVNAGHYATRTLKDGWTVVTVDGSLSAQFEHTVAIGPDGPEVLTLP